MRVLTKMEERGARGRVARLTIAREEKLNALKIWEQDARQMLTASGEGMAGSEEGTDPNDHSMLGQVERAKDKLQRSAKPAVSRGRI